MEKTLDLKLSVSEASRLEPAIAKCEEALRRIFRRMKKDQAEIEKLKAQTRARLADMKSL